MMEERGAIERKYAASLAQWSTKWQNKIVKGQEVYSRSTRAAWRSLLTEADRTAEQHTKVEVKISGELQNKIQLWKKDNYQKSMMANKTKVQRKAEEGFEKAQKP
jgi:hypothetical protein